MPAPMRRLGQVNAGGRPYASALDKDDESPPIKYVDSPLALRPKLLSSGFVAYNKAGPRLH